MEVRMSNRGVEDAVALITAKLREKRATTDRRPPDEVIAEVVSGGHSSGALDELARLSAALLEDAVGTERFADLNAEEILAFTL
jgi:hypothetical protein